MTSVNWIMDMGRRLLFYAAAKNGPQGKAHPAARMLRRLKTARGIKKKRPNARCHPCKTAQPNRRRPKAPLYRADPRGNKTAKACQAAWRYPCGRSVPPVRRTFYGCAFSASDIAHPSTSNSKFFRVYLINQTCPKLKKDSLKSSGC